MKELTYSDIALLPQKCVVENRDECDTSVEFGPRRFVMPVYPSNMKSVVNQDTCEFLAKRGYFYSYHRFGSDSLSLAKRMRKNGLFISISIGINEDSYDKLNDFLMDGTRPDYITIDVANAWSDKAKKMVVFIKKKFPKTFLIIGNIATAEAIKDIQNWGVDSCKIGIAGGKVCITKNKTGFHRPLFSTLHECIKETNLPLIADGGIIEHGDIAKAIAGGASMVMAGYLFAGYDQSAGNIIEIDDNLYKEYYGSASKFNKNELRNVEGKKILIKYRGDMERLLIELREDLQSSISYGGGKEIKNLKSCPYIIIGESK